MDGNYGQNQNWQNPNISQPNQNHQEQNQPYQNWQNANQGQPNQYWQNANQGQPNQYWQNANQGQPNQYWQNANQGQSNQYWQNANQNQPNQYWQNPNQNWQGPNMNGYPIPNVPGQGYGVNNGYNYYAPNGYNGPYAAASAVPTKKGGLAIGSLICGIVSMVCFWSLITMLLAVVGIVLAALNNTQGNPNKGMAIAGIVLNIVGIVLTAAFIFIIVMLW